MTSEQEWQDAALGMPPRVLVLEDHALQRDVLIVALRRAGVSHVWGAADGRSALDLLQRIGTVDVVISDLMMDGLDGVAFLTELGQLAQPPAVILASAAEHSIIDSVEQMGRGLGLYMAGRLPKPATFEQLVARLRAGLARPMRDNQHLEFAELASVPELQRGLAAGEFIPYYQVRRASHNATCLGVEAMPRWRHPEQGLLLPADFEPVLRHAGLGDQLTWQLLRQILIDVQQWAQHGLVVPVSITVTGDAIRNPSFPDQLREVVATAGFSPTMLTLAVTATELVADIIAAQQVCARLRMNGFGLAFDDFGSASQTFVLLLRLPFDELRICPRSLIGTQEAAAEKIGAVLHCLLDMGRNLGLRTVVKNVDRAADFAVMQQLQPDAIQGNHIAPALPSDDLLRWWKNAEQQ